VVLVVKEDKLIVAIIGFAIIVGESGRLRINEVLF
jgi:hypothetical protein